MFDAVLISDTDGKPKGALTQVDDADLPEGDVTVDIAYSSLNYKDALAITGSAPIARKLPMVAGIDFAGTVADSTDGRYAVGDQVLVTGRGLSETHWGGLSQRARVPGDFIVPLPKAFSPAQAMAIGTAGFTAMLCVLALEDHHLKLGSKVLVTGANGGVGSVAVAVLAKLGHHVIASTGRVDQAEGLTRLGAAEVIDRAELSEPGKPLAKTRWDAAVDTVGGQTLVNVCAALNYGGTVAATGNAGGMDFPASVAPFILRAVTLAGVDSVQAPHDRRLLAWERLASDLDLTLLDELTTEIGLADVVSACGDLLAGRVRGRTVVRTRD